jgi:hypothetical protein
MVSGDGMVVAGAGVLVALLGDSAGADGLADVVPQAARLVTPIRAAATA